MSKKKEESNMGDLCWAVSDGPIVAENITIDQRYKFEQQIKSLRESIADLQKTNSQLEEKLRIATEALEFYASPDSYDFHSAWGKVSILESDTEIQYVFNMKTNLGGKRAREAIAAIKGKQ